MSSGPPSRRSSRVSSRPRPPTVAVMLAAPLVVLALLALGPMVSAWGETPTPQPVPTASALPQREGDTSEPSGTDWALALGAALAGSMITVLLERWRESSHERHALGTMLHVVRLEIDDASSQIQQRARRKDLPEVGIAFDEPLTTTAWSTVLSSGIAWRLAQNTELYTQLAAYYAAVHRANHCAVLAGTMFDYSQQPHLDAATRSSYFEQARELTIAPLPDLESTAANALEALDKRKGASA